MTAEKQEYRKEALAKTQNWFHLKLERKESVSIGDTNNLADKGDANTGIPRTFHPAILSDFRKDRKVLSTPSVALQKA